MRAPCEFVPTASPAAPAPIFNRVTARPPSGGLFGLFLSCAPGGVCAFRQNSKSRVVIFASNGTVESRVDNSDDSRVFEHDGHILAINNRHFQQSLLLIRHNGSVKRELALPLAQSKNLVPLSWTPSQLFLLDMPQKRLWPAQVDRRDTVALQRALKISMIHQDAEEGACALPDGCSMRAGTAGLRIQQTSTAVGAGYCTGTEFNKQNGRIELKHASFWWELNIATMILRVQPLCLSRRLVVDPTTLLANYSGSSKNRTVSFQILSTETDRARNSHRNQRYYNERYISDSVRVSAVSSAEPLAPPSQTAPSAAAPSAAAPAPVSVREAVEGAVGGLTKPVSARRAAAPTPVPVAAASKSAAASPRKKPKNRGWIWG